MHMCMNQLQGYTVQDSVITNVEFVLYCIVLYLLLVLNPKSYDGARVLEASGRPMLVIGRSYWFVPIQDVDVNAEVGTKLAEETTEKSSLTEIAGGTGTKLAEETME